MNDKAYPFLDNFSITESGLLHKLLVRVKLDGVSKKNVIKRILFIAAITWLPMLVLSALQGQLIGNSVDVSFWKDFSCHTRYLIIIPILILAERSVDFHLKELTAQFFKSGILDKNDLGGYEAIKKKVTSLASSYRADILIILVIILNVVLRWHKLEADKTSIWMFLAGSESSSLSWGGIYFALVSLPFLQFIMFRWVWRWIIWLIYFSRLSKLPLKLNSAHPDKAGGLGFLGYPPGPFTQVLFAIAILFSATIAEKIFFLHERLPAYYPVMTGFAVLSILMNLVPLLVFIKPLQIQRRKGFFEYSALIQEHHRQFDEKWLQRPHVEPLPGIPDASSMTDFNTSFDVVRSMNVIPFDIKIMLSSILIAILPMLPLFAFEYNLVDLIAKVLKMLV
jgi:hypothetical protein